MLVSAISNKNQPNFGTIYVQKNDYTDNQKNVINQIKNELQKPSSQFIQSAETYYKSNNGIDFFMESGVRHADTILLSGCKGVKRSGVGVDEAITYRDSFTIGTYDKEHPFKTDDIEYGIKEYNKQTNGFLANACLSLVVMMFFILITALELGGKAERNAKDAAKPLIENIDSAAGKAIDAVHDTISVLG